MIKFLKRYFIHTDERGKIEGIINFGRWEEINIISSQANSIRGNHYHKETLEVFIILEGEIEVEVQRVKNNKLIGKPKVYNVRQGDAFLIKQNVIHTFKLKTDSKWINILSKKIDKRNPDIYRIVK